MKMCSGFTYSCSCTRKQLVADQRMQRIVRLHLVDLDRPCRKLSQSGDIPRSTKVVARGRLQIRQEPCATFGVTAREWAVVAMELRRMVFVTLSAMSCFLVFLSHEHQAPMPTNAE